MLKKIINVTSQTGEPIQRKAIDVSGGLGSLYDVSTDNIVEEYSVKAFQTKIPNPRCIARLYSGAQSNEEIRFLEEIDFDDALRQSILLQMVDLSGICSLMDYNRPIDQNTRILYYSYQNKIDKIHVEAGKTDPMIIPPLTSTHATHMITKILWGIEFLCIIQLPTNQSVRKFDELLRFICDELKNNELPIRLDNDNEYLIDQLTDITVYGSETCIDDSNIPISTILNRIQEWQYNTKYHQPLEYTMQPLRWLFNDKQFPQTYNWPQQEDSQMDRIEPILIRLKNEIRYLQEMLNNIPTNFSSQALNQRSNDCHQKFDFVLSRREHFQERLQNTLIDIRLHRISSKELENIISDRHYTCLYPNEMDSFCKTVKQLLKKANIIEDLEKDQIEYINAFDIHSNEQISTDINVILKDLFSNENSRVILWYSSDRLKREQAQKWKDIYQQLISEQQQSRQPIKLVYVDFTQYPQWLDDFIIVRLPMKEIPRSKRSSVIELTSQSQLSSSLPSLLKSSATDFNVLLLGETGVGKSTFINAFINYLKFETLQQAEQGDLTVLIPASFLIAVGDQFDEFIVKFGTVDSNENDKHQGQSATQQCRSYIFDLYDETRLRFIDTPGIGDIRGTIQDMYHMDHILNYINSLSHINAICLFLKPNSSRMNIFFRSCIHQLLTYLAPTGYENIIFCFTNTRATCYAPGESGPLIRKMLNNEQLNDIPFKKENIFCFDNESFRYLAARKCDIDFNDYQRNEYKNSWNASITEFVRLINFIQTNKPYYLEEWISPRKALLDIYLLARPLMETLRLFIYNWVLNEAKLFDDRMELISNSVAIDICTDCAQMNIIEVGPFWLTQYQRILSKCKEIRDHHCPANRKHFLLEVIIEHHLVTNRKNERWRRYFQDLLFKCDRLLHFLRQQDSLNEDDPFKPIIERFIAEEQQISRMHHIESNMNRRVNEILHSIKQRRQQNSQELFALNEKLSISEIYELINELMDLPSVKKQIRHIKRSRQLKMAAYGCRIPIDFIKNKAFI